MKGVIPDFETTTSRWERREYMMIEAVWLPELPHFFRQSLQLLTLFQIIFSDTNKPGLHCLAFCFLGHCWVILPSWQALTCENFAKLAGSYPRGYDQAQKPK